MVGVGIPPEGTGMSHFIRPLKGQARGIGWAPEGTASSVWLSRSWNGAVSQGVFRWFEKLASELVRVAMAVERVANFSVSSFCC